MNDLISFGWFLLILGATGLIVALIGALKMSCHEERASTAPDPLVVAMGIFIAVGSAFMIIIGYYILLPYPG